MCLYAGTKLGLFCVGWRTIWWNDLDTKGPRYRSAGFLLNSSGLVFSPLSLLLSVCGLPPASRRNWDWSPGSNPKQEAPLWALLFPTQVWVLVFVRLQYNCSFLANFPCCEEQEWILIMHLKPNVLGLGFITVQETSTWFACQVKIKRYH